MAKDERRVRIGVVASILFLAFFWFSIITVIIGKIEMSVLGLIGYTITIILFEYYIWKENKNLKKKILILLLVEAMQLVPYGIILLIRSLIS